MRCPTLAELPPPSKSKTGWPWTEETPQLPDIMPAGYNWPKISVVTPSFNQGKFLEETIRSVLLQGYPNLEYIIIDGGSNDESVDIIRKYEKWIAYWVSEPDRGQSHAINKGLNISEGEIAAWINSDDLYLPGCFKRVAGFVKETHYVHMVYGACSVIDENSNKIGEPYVPVSFDLKRLVEQEDYIPQPSVFFQTSIFKEIGGIIETLQYSMDYELWIRIGCRYQVKKIDAPPLCCFRIQPQQKTFRVQPAQYRENLWIRARHGGLKQKYQYVRHLIAEQFYLIKKKMRMEY